LTNHYDELQDNLADIPDDGDADAVNSHDTIGSGNENDDTDNHNENDDSYDDENNEDNNDNSVVISTNMNIDIDRKSSILPVQFSPGRILS
jgi:hypothetical protein